MNVILTLGVSGFAPVNKLTGDGWGVGGVSLAPFDVSNFIY